jgi:hypothetical protein
MSTKSREVIYGSRIRGAETRAQGARERAVQAVREARRGGGGLVDPNGGLRRAGAAVADDRPMPQAAAQ